LDAAQIRRDVRRVFGRIEHGEGFSQLTNRRITASDVFVFVTTELVEERRKSGADAWSARIQKGSEVELTLAEFLSLSSGAARDTAAEDARIARASPNANERRAFIMTQVSQGTSEPPYHRARRVVARWRDEPPEKDKNDLEINSEEEILWDVNTAVSSWEESAQRLAGGTARSGSRPDAFGTYGSYGTYGTYGSYGSPGARSGSPGARGFHPDASSPRRRRAETVDALSLLPRHCWEGVFSFCDPRAFVRLGATCFALAEISRSRAARQAQHAKLFGRPAPVGQPRAPTPARSGAPPAPPATPAALEEAAAKKGWAATCASFLAADAWIPRRRFDLEVSDDEDQSEESESESDAESDADADAACFDEDDFDFERKTDFGENIVAGRRRTRVVVATTTRASELAGANVPRPLAKYRNVGPHSARHALANAATCVSCDGSKIKLWFHGGDGVTESGKRIATLPNPAGSKPWTSLTAGFGTFVAGDAAGRLTVWDADALEVRHARVQAVAARSDVLGAPAEPTHAALTALATVPTSGLVACSGRATSVVRVLNVSPENDPAGASPATAFDVNLGDRGLEGRVDGSGFGEAPGIDSLVVSGAGDAYRDASDTRGFAPRLGRDSTGAPKLWAVVSGGGSFAGGGGGGGRLVSVDLETGAPIERFAVPEFRTERSPWNACDIARRADSSVDAASTHGDLLVVSRDGCAIIWDTRSASESRADPVAAFWDASEPASPSLASGAFSRGHVALDDWSVWVSQDGGDGVRLYDARRAAGPPRARERWHATTSQGTGICSVQKYCAPVAIFGAGDAGAGGGGVGAFARAGAGALVVAPISCDYETHDAPSARCSVYTSGHHGDEASAERGGSREETAWEDGFGKNAKASKKKAARKVRKKYPKRQGGKFRARTAGG
jgi:hypothetical protein